VVGAAAQDRDGRPFRGLEVLSRRTPSFGHQSVRMNTLEGVRELAARENVALRIEEQTGAAGLAGGTLTALPGRREGHGESAAGSTAVRLARERRA
jgi:hypothetical protein